MRKDFLKYWESFRLLKQEIDLTKLLPVVSTRLNFYLYVSV